MNVDVDSNIAVNNNNDEDDNDNVHVPRSGHTSTGTMRMLTNAALSSRTSLSRAEFISLLIDRGYKVSHHLLEVHVSRMDAR